MYKRVSKYMSEIEEQLSEFRIYERNRGAYERVSKYMSEIEEHMSEFPDI